MPVSGDLTIPFPLELLLPATPVSQEGSPRRKRLWQDEIAEYIRGREPEGCYSHQGPVAVEILYFPPGRMQGDIDNIVKPILDAMCNRVYADDAQVVSVFVKKFEPGRVVDIDNPIDTLTEAISGDPPVVYIKVSHSEG